MQTPHRNRNTLFCFSPPVMIATFAIEALLLVYTLVRYRTSQTGRIIASLLVCLAIFQFAEYQVCGVNASVANWSRVGYVAIALLPALGLHLVTEIAGRKSRAIVGAGYASSIMFAGAFAFDTAAFVGHACAGNYAIFQLSDPYGDLFFAYYYALLIAGIVMSLRYSRTAKPDIRKALTFQVIGYLSFILPTGMVNALNPQTFAGIPSIMCGFAVIYALVLVFGIAPLVLFKRNEAESRVTTHAN